MIEYGKERSGKTTKILENIISEYNENEVIAIVTFDKHNALRLKERLLWLSNQDNVNTKISEDDIIIIDDIRLIDYYWIDHLFIDEISKTFIKNKRWKFYGTETENCKNENKIIKKYPKCKIHNKIKTVF